MAPPVVKALFPLDGSETTYRTVEKGLQLLRGDPSSSATFLVVLAKNVRDMPPEAREHLEFDDEDELFIRDDEAKAVLNRAIEIAKKARFTNAKGIAIAGKVRDVILAEAKRHDLLVMHGLRRSEREDKKHGNMTEELARQAGCSVLLVRAD